MKEPQSVDKIISDFRDCRNELCALCGRYKEAHKGLCDNCKWYRYWEDK